MLLLDLHDFVLSLTVLFPKSMTLQDSSTGFPFIAVILCFIVVVLNVGPVISCSLLEVGVNPINGEALTLLNGTAYGAAFELGSPNPKESSSFFG